MIRLMPVFLAPVLLALSACDSAPAPGAQGPGEESAAPGGQGLSGQSSMPPPGEITRMAQGETIPDVTVRTPDGETLDLANLDQPVLVNLWATWCAPCKVEMPLLDQLAGELDGEVRVLPISQDVGDAAGEVEEYFAQSDFERLEPWLDPESDLGVALTQGGLLPTTVLYDADGEELFRVAGDYEWDSEEAIAAIREAIAA